MFIAFMLHLLVIGYIQGDISRHSPDIPGGFDARIAPLNELGNGKSPSPRAKGRPGEDAGL
jgi:hypothetical protein